MDGDGSCMTGTRYWGEGAAVVFGRLVDAPVEETR